MTEAECEIPPLINLDDFYNYGKQRAVRCEKMVSSFYFYSLLLLFCLKLQPDDQICMQQAENSQAISLRQKNHIHSFAPPDTPNSQKQPNLMLIEFFTW